MKINKLVFILFISLILLSLSFVSAQDNSTDSDIVTVHVNSTDSDVTGVNEDNSIYVSTKGMDFHKGTPDSPLKTIKRAISLSGDNGTIYLSDGEFSGNLNSKLTVSKSLTFVGGKNTVINGLNSNYLFEIADGVTVNFVNIKFINAYKAPESYSASYNKNVYGAALDIKNAKVTVENCSFLNSVISYGSRDNYVYGGAISNFGDLTIINSYFKNNTALSTSGLFSYGGSVYNKGKLSICNSTFSKSSSIDFGYGATIANDGEVIMKNSVISEASALHECKGSAIYNTGDFKLYNSIIENNYIERSNFNYIYGVVYNSGTLTAVGSIFRNNTGYYEAPTPAYKGSPNIYNIGLLNLTYNAFMDNAPFDGISTDIFFNGGEIISIDNNWWNTNENPYKADSKINVDEINSWLILNVTPDYSKLNISDSVMLNVSWTNNINLLPQISLIPVFNVTFKTDVGGNQIISNKQLVNGKANFEFNYTQNKGLYEVITYLGSFNQKAQVDVGKVMTYIKYDVDDNITYLDDLTVNVEVVSADGSVPTGVVLLKIGEETYTVNLVNGKGTCKISDLTPQKYTLNMIYEGSENHFKAFNKTSVNINKLDVDLALNIPEIKVGQKGQAIVTLSPKGVQGQAILYVDGVRKKIVYLYNGDTTISLNNFAEGKYNITLEFVENSYYNSAKVSGILNVTRYESSINISADDIKVGENATITVKVSPDSLRGEATLIINGVNNTIFIDDTVTNVTLTNLGAGAYNVTLIFDGDLRYNPVTTSTSFNVLRTPVDLSVNIIQDDKNLNGTISVKLNSTNCTGVVGVYVNYNVYRINVTGGEAEFSVKFDKGTNYIFVFYEGDEYFDEATWNTTLGVADEFVFIGENSTGFAGNDFSYSVRLIEVNGIPMPGRTVTIEFNDKKYNVTTNDDGYALFNLNLSEGSYTISASYKNATVHNTLTVKKVDFNLTADNISYGEAEVIKATFENGVKGNVTFNIGDLSISVEIVNGTAVYNTSSLNAGKYTVTAIYNGIAHDAEFNVAKSELDWQITVNPATPYIDEIIDVSNLGDASGEITFVFNGIEYKVDINDNAASLNLNKLDEGRYSITVKYGGDANYLPANETLSFYVKQFASDLTLSVNDAPYAGDLIVTATLNDNATGVVRFNVADITKEISIVNGKAVWNFTGIDVGNYTVTAKYLGDEYYVESENSTSFSVYKASSAIRLYVKEVSLGENIRIYADLSPNATGSVSFSMIGYFSPRNKPISNSASTWYIAPLNTGEYTVIAKYVGDKNYLASNTTYILNVSQRKTVLNVELNDAGINDRVVCKISLKTKDGFGITDTVSLRIGNNVYNIEIKDGSGSLVLGKLAVGNYAYNVEYAGSENFTSASVDGSFKVIDDLLEADLTCNNLTMYYGGSDKLVVSLKNSNGNPFASQIIIVRINSKEYTLFTDSNGEASLDIDFNPGVYNASIIFEETSRYKSASTSARINVLSTVEGIDVIKLYGSGTQYFAAFVDSNGKALGNTEVTFTISGNSYKLTTMPNGIAKINVNFKVGTYVISTVNPATGQKLSNKITIYYYIVGKDSSNYDGSKTTYKVRIYSGYQKPVGAGKVVKFKVNGKTYKVKTDKKGYAKLAIKLKPKKYTVTVTYSKYKVSNKITVKKLLSAKNISKKKSKTTKFQAKLVNSKGVVQKGKKITFKIDGKKYTAKTNKKGLATITIKTTLKVGKHKIVSSYGKTKITNTITIKK